MYIQCYHYPAKCRKYHQYNSIKRYNNDDITVMIATQTEML